MAFTPHRSIVIWVPPHLVRLPFQPFDGIYAPSSYCHLGPSPSGAFPFSPHNLFDLCRWLNSTAGCVVFSLFFLFLVGGRRQIPLGVNASSLLSHSTAFTPRRLIVIWVPPHLVRLPFHLTICLTYAGG
jgi:hypothetical protein